MKAAEAKQRYQMVLQEENAKTYLVMIKPLLQDDKDSFSIAWINLDKRFLLPTRIYLLAPDGKSSKDFRLSQIKPNTDDVKPSLFVGVAPPKPWKVERNPGGAGVQVPANGKRRAVSPGARPPSAGTPDQMQPR